MLKPRLCPLLECSPIRDDLLHGIATELLDDGISEDDRDHRFADDGGGGNRADVAALHGRRTCLHRREVDRSGFIRVEIGFMYAVTRRSSPLVTPPSRPPALLVGRATPTVPGAVPLGRGTISSCTREPGSVETAGPRPIPTALIAGIDISACARRPSSFRSH